MEGRNTNKNKSCRSLHENLALQIEQLVIEQYTKKCVYCTALFGKFEKVVYFECAKNQYYKMYILIFYCTLYSD